MLEEQYQDIIDNCTVYLTALEKVFVESNDTPEGRMISQLRWLKQEAKGERLPLPVDLEYTGTIRHIAVEHSNLMNAATPLWKIYHIRLLALIKGRLLAKPEHNDIVKPLLTYLLANLPESDKLYRPKLVELKTLVDSEKVTFPIDSDNFNSLGLNFSTSDIIRFFPEGIQTMEMISEYCFKGVRDLENSPYTMCQRRKVHKPAIAKY